MQVEHPRRLMSQIGSGPSAGAQIEHVTGQQLIGVYPLSATTVSQSDGTAVHEPLAETTAQGQTVDLVAAMGGVSAQPGAMRTGIIRPEQADTQQISSSWLNITASSIR